MRPTAKSHGGTVRVERSGSITVQITASRVLGFPDTTNAAEERILGYLSSIVGNMKFSCKLQYKPEGPFVLFT